MRYIIDHDYHLHTHLSLCSNDPQQTPQSILEYAQKNNLTNLVLTDHYWDENVPGAQTHGFYGPQNYAHIAQALPLPQKENIKFFFGCETDMDKFCTLGVSRPVMDKFDFIVVPTTHLHMVDFTIDRQDDSLPRRKELYIQRMDKLLDMDLPFEKIGIAHLTCSLMAPGEWERHLMLIDSITDEEFTRLFAKAAKRGCGIELNGHDIEFREGYDAERLLRPYRIAKREGCKFYLGSDAHSRKELEHIREAFEKIIDALELEENDKFYFPGQTSVAEELKIIMEKFAASGWDVIDGPAKQWLAGTADRDVLIQAIQEADAVCGSCGCEFDPLYKRALALL